MSPSRPDPGTEASVESSAEVSTQTASQTPGADGVLVRPATPDELDAAGEAVRAAYAADGVGHETYHRVLADARDRALDAVVAVAVGERHTVLGTVTFALPGSRWAELSGPGEAEFRMLGVVPAARGRGVGLALVDWCIDRARAGGLTRLVICSEDSMRAAHRIYDRRGFVRRPELDWSPVPGVRLIGFTLDLG